MIIGIGTDIVDISRIAKKITDRKDFLEHVFSSFEIQYCEKIKNKFESYAARFAAKEAFLKAIGTGLLIDCAPKEIEVRNDTSGKPELIISPNVKNKLEEIFKVSNHKIHISLSHTSQTAIAFIIIESL